MKNRSIKLLAAVSTMLMANVFGSGLTAADHVLPTKGFEPHSGVVCDPKAAVTSAGWNPKTTYCFMTPECGNGDQFTFEVVDDVNNMGLYQIT